MLEEKCNIILEALLGNNELISIWWSTQNRAFEFQTPRDVFQTDPDKVVKYLYRMINSEYS